MLSSRRVSHSQRALLGRAFRHLRPSLGQLRLLRALPDRAFGTRSLRATSRPEHDVTRNGEKPIVLCGYYPAPCARPWSLRVLGHYHRGTPATPGRRPELRKRWCTPRQGAGYHRSRSQTAHLLSRSLTERGPKLRLTQVEGQLLPHPKFAVS